MILAFWYLKNVGHSEELRNVLKWAEHNKMQVNMTKTKDIVFHRPNARNVLFLALKEYYVPSCWVFGCRPMPLDLYKYH